MLAPVLVTPPAVLPVALDDIAGAKAQARVDDTNEDGLIEAYIEAAIAHLDGWSGVLGRALITQTWRQDFRCFAEKLRLPLAPVQSIASVMYWDAGNVQQTLAAASYAQRADGLGPYVELAPGEAWPSVYGRTDAVSVEFVAGYGATAAAVPAPIRQAIRMMVAHWVANREAVNVGNITTELPLGVQALMGPYRRPGI